MFKNLNETWDLDVIFPGGSQSVEFGAYLDALENDIASLDRSGVGGNGVSSWVSKLERIQNLTRRLRQAGAFASCLGAQDVNDKQARVLSSRVRQIQASFGSIMTMVDKELLAITDLEWNKLLQNDDLKPLAFNLNERRERAKGLLPSEQETLVNELSVDGYHGWSDLYDMVTGKMTITIEENGKAVTMSPGQAANRMSGPDPVFRAHVMSRWEEAWSQQADLCALALNRLGGYRLALYKKRGWDSVLQEPLEYNRMTGKTLDAMWDTIDANKGRLVTYMRRKQRILGLDSLGWQDLGAPVGSASSKMSYSEAAEFIVEQFQRFSPAMAALATRAFKERWIEAEDRPGKRMGGFCTSFLESKVSRIFVTFSGTPNNVSTIAHELGHAFHQSVMSELPPMTQQYAMNVAETASTFSEMIVADAAVKNAKTPEERLMLLDGKLSGAVSLLMNIQCRFLFETKFYKERAKGMVSAQRLNELMVEAQKEAFADSLGQYHPHFWASKLHFYNTRVPFYNFPYTFGFLFSAGVYAQALSSEFEFEGKYRELLRDTGRMRVEDLAKQHLGVDLTEKAFWRSAMDTVLSDLEEFLRITEESAIDAD